MYSVILKHQNGSMTNFLFKTRGEAKGFRNSTTDTVVFSGADNLIPEELKSIPKTESK